MSIQEIFWANKSNIIDAGRFAVIRAMLNTWDSCRRYRRNPQEPDFVAGLVTQCFPQYFHALRIILKAHHMKIACSSVFCHQTPKVTHPDMSKASCELGDLLIAFSHQDSKGAIQRNALLYQAKMSSHQPHRVGNSERDQLNLYEFWPDFNYYNSNPLTGRRSVLPKSRHLGAQYLLIDDRNELDAASGLLGLEGTHPVSSCMPDRCLIHHNPIQDELFSFLQFRSGRSFDAKDSTDGWSKVIWDLLKVSLQKAFNRRFSGFKDHPRYIGDDLTRFDGYGFFASNDHNPGSIVTDALGHKKATKLYAGNNEIPPFNHNFYQNEDGAGISLVLIETSERSEE